MGLKEIAITAAIAVLFTTFVLVSIDAFYPRPEYGDFCQDTYPKRAPMPVINCTPVEPSPVTERCWQEGGMPIYDYDKEDCQVFKECSFCGKDFEEAQKSYNNIIMLIIAPLGAIAIIIGVLYGVEFIGSGFMFSGIILMFYGTIQNFEHLNRYMRVAVVFAELLLVLFIAYKKVIKRPELVKKHESKPAKARK